MTSMSPEKLTDSLKRRALEIGFDLVGATAAVELSEDHRLFRKWCDEGSAAGMDYLSRNADARLHPRSILPEVVSVLVVALNYRTVEPAEPQPGEATISRYGWGVDYHQVMRGMLRELGNDHRGLTPDARVRGTVDTAPIFERACAVRAGLGRIGKNTTLITDRFGSWVVLGTLLTSAKLVSDQPLQGDPCGDCTLCVDACPSAALTRPHHLDARRCLSYQTIEPTASAPSYSSGSSPALSVRDDRLFGCDTCQSICPHNHETESTKRDAFFPLRGNNPVQLLDLLLADPANFDVRFKDSPLIRPSRIPLLLGAIDVLYRQAMSEDRDSSRQATQILSKVADEAADAEVREAAKRVIDLLSSPE